MTLLLHLSDLHLAPDEDDEDLGDYKIDIVPKVERQRRVTALRQTMRALGKHLSEAGQELDAIVVSGDITYRGSRSGFEGLPSLIHELGDQMPSQPDRVIVVPGNHDVHWETRPSAPERYSAFVELIRSCGYSTPILEGVDTVDPSGHSTPGPVVQINDDVVVAAMNSANYSGALEGVPHDLLVQIEELISKGYATKSLASQFHRLRLHDVARISPEQLNAVAQSMDSTALQPDAVRIAVMHHQLLPVGSEEEVKTFETFTNLGEIIAFLVANEFDIVLHGHKHTPMVYEDLLRNFAQLHVDQPSALRRCIVVSCGTIGMGQHGPDSETAKLIDIQTGPGKLKRVKIKSVPSVTGGGRLRSNTLRPVGDFPIRRSFPIGGPKIISGQDVSSVHEQLVELFDENSNRTISGLICHVSDSASAQSPPRTYPFVNPKEGLNAWFKDLVEWWQSEEPGKDKPYTHGQRLRHWNGNRDQLENILAELKVKKGTSRAVAVLVDPNEDHNLGRDYRPEFPAFCLVQFTLLDGQLNATALFRKQEMKYWWPINVAEISKLQTGLARRLGAEVSARPGSITTYAVIAVAGSTVPRVAVPKIDRAVWEEPNLRWQISAALFDSAVPCRTALIERLRDMLTEWRPTSEDPAPDGVPMPVHGLQAIQESLAALQEVYPASQSAEELVRLLRQIAAVNEGYRDRDLSDVRLYRAWKAAVLPLITQAEVVCAVTAGEPKEI